VGKRDKQITRVYSSFRLMLRSSKLIFKYLRGTSIILTLITTLQGLIPIVNVFLIGRLAAAFLESDFTVSNHVILISLTVVALMCVEFSLVEINHLIRNIMTFKIEYKLRNDLINHVEKLDIRYREQSEYHTILSRAMQAISPNEMFTFLDLVTTVVSAVMTSIGVLLLLLSINIFIPVINIVALVLVAYRIKYASKKINSFYESINENERELEAIYSTFVDDNTIAEMRIFRSFTWFKQLWKVRYDQINTKKRKFNTKTEFVTAFIVFILPCIPIISIIIFLISTSSFSSNKAVDTINIFNSCAVLTSNIVMLSYASGSFTGNLIKFENYFKLFDINLVPVRTEGEIYSPAKIELKKVSFSYNNESGTPALMDVNALFESGKIYAIVGDNGSGKTTLAKIIMELFRPTTGSVIMQGSNGCETVLRTTTVMQDFCRYDVSLKDNIIYGDPDKDYDAQKFQNAVKAGECEHLIEKIGLDTMLGMRFGKVNLSGGEWQRVAVARGSYRQECSLIVFDEPNSSVDAITESKIINNMISQSEGKICIFITHRLSSVRFADYIYVMKNGSITEYGTHEELISLNGEYYRMFSAQVSWYQ
jgi:ATP-binding cassette, subfamily B, bacterial